MTYTFDVKLFDNEIDRGYKRFSFSALKQFAKMSCGKKGTFRGKRVAEVIDAKVVVEKEKITKAGDPFCWVKAQMRVEINNEASELLYEMESTEKPEISVGCSVEHRVCSVCGGECLVMSQGMSTEASSATRSCMVQTKSTNGRCWNQ